MKNVWAQSSGKRKKPRGSVAFTHQPVSRLKLAWRASATCRRLPMRAASGDVGGRNGYGSCAQEYDTMGDDAIAVA
ncbi:hypothetical protein FNF07_08850 [Trinickia caryophylli]|nr:hypothetical protein FNF07_08850 [Trinickia caryophylli]